MLVLTPKYSSLNDLDLLKTKKEQTKDKLITHRLAINLTQCTDIKKAYLTFLANKGKYFIGYKPKDVKEIHSWACRFANELDVSFIDVSDLTSLRSCFARCKRLTKINGLNKWDVSKCTDMANMFYDCYGLTEISGIENWNTEACQHMGSMFMNCKDLTNISSMSDWNVSNVLNMSEMFNGCDSLEELDLTAWRPRSCTGVYLMFGYCKKLTTVGDLSDWRINTAHGPFVAAMFYNCVSLHNVGDMTKWGLSLYLLSAALRGSVL